MAPRRESDNTTDVPAAAAPPQTSKSGWGCRLLPHGGYTLLPATLATIAWMTSLSQDGCDYAQLKGPIVNELATTSPYNPPYLEVGMTAYREPIYDYESGQWKFQYHKPCLQYPPEFEPFLDKSWNVSKGFAFMSLVFGGGGALFLWFSSCFVFGPATWRWAGYEVLVASIFQCLTFLWFNTKICTNDDHTCSLSYGSRTDIASAVLWGFSALSIFLKYPNPAPKMSLVATVSTPSSETSPSKPDDIEGGNATDTTEEWTNASTAGESAPTAASPCTSQNMPVVAKTHRLSVTRGSTASALSMLEDSPSPNNVVAKMKRLSVKRGSTTAAPTMLDDMSVEFT